MHNFTINVWSHHQYLGGTTQPYEKHLHYIAAFIPGVLTDDTDDLKCHGYGVSTPQVS